MRSSDQQSVISEPRRGNKAIMHAIRIHAYGAPDVMQWEELPLRLPARDRFAYVLKPPALIFWMCKSGGANLWGRRSTAVREQ